LADAPVEAEVGKIIKQKQRFERLVITKEEGLRLFADNPFKVRILSTKVPDGGRTTVYRCGDLIDLCRGPHVPHTGKIKAFAATRHSATNWLGDTANDSLQRLYGISFPDKKMLKVWKENQEKVRGVRIQPSRSWVWMLKCARQGSREETIYYLDVCTEHTS
jgi:threonyl-tRNA synthetase